MHAHACFCNQYTIHTEKGKKYLNVNNNKKNNKICGHKWKKKNEDL